MAWLWLLVLPVGAALAVVAASTVCVLRRGVGIRSLPRLVLYLLIDTVWARRRAFKNCPLPSYKAVLSGKARSGVEALFLGALTSQFEREFGVALPSNFSAGSFAVLRSRLIVRALGRREIWLQFETEVGSSVQKKLQDGEYQICSWIERLLERRPSRRRFYVAGKFKRRTTKDDLCASSTAFCAFFKRSVDSSALLFLEEVLAEELPAVSDHEQLGEDVRTVVEQVSEELLDDSPEWDDPEKLLMRARKRIEAVAEGKLEPDVVAALHRIDVYRERAEQFGDTIFHRAMEQEETNWSPWFAHAVNAAMNSGAVGGMGAGLDIELIKRHACRLYVCWEQLETTLPELTSAPSAELLVEPADDDSALSPPPGSVPPPASPTEDPPADPGAQLGF